MKLQLAGTYAEIKVALVSSAQARKILEKGISESQLDRHFDGVDTYCYAVSGLEFYGGNKCLYQSSCEEADPLTIKPFHKREQWRLLRYD